MTPFEKATRAGIAAAMTGIVLVALAPIDSALRPGGGVLLLAGWLVGAWGLHRYGRQG